MLIRTKLRDRDDDFWRLWAMRALLTLGAAHFLAGVVFFFAYNWDDLGPFARFALLQGALVVALVALAWNRTLQPAEVSAATKPEAVSDPGQ